MANVGFNGPDPYRILSDAAIKWLKKNPGMLTNYRNRGDKTIGNLMGNKTGAEILVSLEMGGRLNIIDYHQLSAWKFDDKGKLLIPKKDFNKKAVRQQAERALLFEFLAKGEALKLLKNKLKASGGGLSTNEQIYLDDSQALAVIESASAQFKLAMTSVIKLYQDGIQEAESFWQEALSEAYSSGDMLEEWEIKEALESGGATEESMVHEPCERYQEKITKAKSMGEKFDALTNEIKAQIAKLVQKDQELARQL